MLRGYVVVRINRQLDSAGGISADGAVVEVDGEGSSVVAKRESIQAFRGQILGENLGSVVLASQLLAGFLYEFLQAGVVCNYLAVGIDSAVIQVSYPDPGVIVPK